METEDMIVESTEDESDGNTVFLRAARDGNLQDVLEYLKGSTDINTSNPNGLNALHLASKEGHINIVTELLKRGANVEAATKKGNTALHISSLAGHEEIVTLLVENGAKVNVQAQMGFTPLYMAAQEGHSEVVKFLLASGANQSLATADGFTPLAVALQQGHERVVSCLLEHDTKGRVRLPALHIAAKKDDIKSAALLLQNEQNNVDSQTKSGSLVNDTTKSGFTPLHIASHYGNINVGSLLISKGADVNYKAKNNITPLHVSSRWGKDKMVILLLDNKASIDERTRDGLTPLHCAARSGHENVVDLLLERGAPFSSKTKNGLTPLHMAAQGDHMDCARLLLYHRAPVDDVTVDYLTPLHVAAHCGNVKTAKLLLDRKCDPNTRALNGFTPLHIACKKNRIKVVELLLKFGANIEATTESGLTPLHVASFMGHMNIVIYLIQNNANPDFTTVRGETALHLAARANQTDIIRILLRNGASVDARARSVCVFQEQQTPLHIAARLGNVDNVTLLLQHGASPDAVTKDLYTPLHIASKEGHEEVASVLLDQGATHSLTTKKGFTPLHIASKYGNIKVARLLLQKDANPDVQGKNGLTPLHVATHYNHVSVALLLLDNKASPHSSAKNGYTPLHIAAKKNQMDIATTLLEFSANPDAESKNGFTPLHLASQEGHTDMVSLLLEHKANVNSKAHNGLTPMHLAAQEDKVNIAEVLVKYGSNTDPQTKAGYTPLHTACHFGQSNMVRFLLEQGASVSATTKLGYTPLHQAAQQGHVQVVNLLLKNKASPNAVTNNHQTALSIAQRLGYLSVVDTLSTVTEVTETVPSSEDKYKVVSPETMQDTLLSDSEDEGGDDFLPQSPLFGKPLSETHVYLPYYEGSKIRSREDSISLERGESTSPLDTSYEKDILRHPVSEDQRRRITSEISSAMRYPSYLERGPDYEAEMRYYSGDTLSPHGRDVSGRGDSVFGGEYSTLDRLSVGKSHDSSFVSQADGKSRITEESSELEYGDDFDDAIKKSTSTVQYAEDFYLRKSVRYGKDQARNRRVYPGSAYRSHPDRAAGYGESVSISSIDLNEEFKYLPDDSVAREESEPHTPLEDYMEAQMMSQSYSQYSSAPPDNRLLTGTSKMESSRFSSYSGSSFNASYDPDNVAIDRTPTYSGKLKWKSFLISFMVDARGGAMRGRRHSGVRIIIPPRKASMPTRVTCRLIKKDKLMHPLPLNEGEALAARILEMGPVATKFLGRIVIEIPHFASLRGKEREIKILRSDNGEKWEEHPILATDDAVNKALNESLEVSDLEHEDDLANKRITRILTDDFPRYFALVTRVREERQSVGEEGGVISSTVVPQVQAVFPEGALTKKIRVGLQAQPISPDLVAKLLGNRVAVSPIVTVEPRRRKFHKTITLTIPVPKAQQKGMINPHRDDLPSLRVLYSISGSNNSLNKEGTDVAIWDDLTEQTQLKLVNDCVSFTTRVSGRFWLMDCQNYSDATRMATELYREAVVVPYMARFVVFAKRTGEQEGKLRMFCMTDDKIDKTLEKQEHFVEVARSRDVEVLEGRQQFVEMAGNLIPITKSGDQLYVDFKAFRENRLPCTVRIRDLDQEPAARVAFMKEPKVARGEVPQTPICNLNISLPDMSTSSSMEMDGDAALELRKRSSLLKEYGIVIEDTVSRAQIKLTDVADTLKGDWVVLAQQLDFTSGEINQIKNDYNTVNDQALAMLQLWAAKDKEQATGNALEKALTRINREDVVKKCMYNVETVEDEVEAAAARVAMDQSGFDTFTEEVGISRDSSMKRGMSLDVQYDEQDIIKESESVAEESGSDVGSVGERSAPQAREEDTEQGDDDQIIMEVDSRRGVAKEAVKHESKEEDFFDLISQMDKYAEAKDKQQTKEQDTEDRQSIQEDEFTLNRHDREAAVSELFSKLEEVGQQSAPQQTASQSQDSDDAEGIKTPPPSPVEKAFPTEQVAPDSEAIKALTESLSFGEPKRDDASQPEETVPPYEEGLSLQTVSEDLQQDVAPEQQVMPVTQGSEFTAPPPLDEDVVNNQFEFLEEEINKANIETEQCVVGDLGTEIPTIPSDIEMREPQQADISSSSVDPKPIEPDMGKVVDSLRKDLVRETSPPEVAGKRSSSLSSSSFSSSSQSLSDHQAEFEEDVPVPSKSSENKETLGEDRFEQDRESPPGYTQCTDTTAEDKETGVEELTAAQDDGAHPPVSESKEVIESSVDPPVDRTMEVSNVGVPEFVPESVTDVSAKETIDEKEEKTPIPETSIEDVVVDPTDPERSDFVQDSQPVQETVVDDVPRTELPSYETPADEHYDSLTSTSSVEIEKQPDSSKESDLDDILEKNIGHLQPAEIASGVQEPDDVDKYQSDEDKLSSSSSSSDSDSSGEHDLQPNVELGQPLADITEQVDSHDTTSEKAGELVSPGSGLDSTCVEHENVSEGNEHEPVPFDEPAKLESEPADESYEPAYTDEPVIEHAEPLQKDTEPDFVEPAEECRRQSSSSSHTTYSSGEGSYLSDSEDGKAIGEDYVDRGEQYEFVEDRASVERVLPDEGPTGVQSVVQDSDVPVVEDVTTKEESSHEECQPALEDLESVEQDMQSIVTESVTTKIESSVSECQPGVEDIEEVEEKTEALAVEEVTTKEESTVEECQPADEDIEEERASMMESFVERGEQYESVGDEATVKMVITKEQETEVDGKHTKHVAFEDSGVSVQGESGVVELGSEVKQSLPLETGCPPTEVGAEDIKEKEGSPLEWRYPGDSEEGDTEGEVFDSNIPPQETRYEETLPDGTVIKHRTVRKFTRQPTLEIEDESKSTDEVTESEGPIREEIDVQESEEILPDGTIHSFQKVRRHSVKHVRKSLKSETGDEDIFEGDVAIPGTNREDIIETFEEPARQVRDVESIEDTLPDGTKVKKQIISSRMVHRIHTHHQSVDEGGEKTEEDYEIDEIIPGTESCFIDNDESSSSSSGSYTDEDDELGGEIEAELGEVEEVLADGSIIRKRVIESHETIRVKSPSGDIDKAQVSKTITEEKYIPSPRSTSPVTVEDEADFHDMAKNVVQRTVRSAHFEAVQRGDEVETTFDKTEDETKAPSGHSLTEASETDDGVYGPIIYGPILDVGVDPRRVASIDDDDFAEYDVTEHKELSLGIPERFVPVAQRSGPIYYEPGDEDQDSEEDEVLDFTTPKHLGHSEDPNTQGAEGADEGSAKLYMKKQIHTKTVMKDGQEQTFVTEESHIQQDNEPPEELRDSMRQIIDQFMEHGGEKEPTSQALEHDV
ncbi:ankyrin-2-like [Ylistrum balloti]|uniref:ankyrin-2-like n=1 Tax=Ylistrum balloti TaxID=509963 RepID=UPI002905D926|nr:ankyrin-2-like [Ylistrum balloti]